MPLKVIKDFRVTVMIFQNFMSSLVEKMNSKFLMLVLLMACTMEVCVHSHILVGRDADIYKDSMRNEDKQMIREFKFRKSLPKRGRKKQLSNKIRRVIAAIFPDAFNTCDDNQT